jgi:hypothetical protein
MVPNKHFELYLSRPLYKSVGEAQQCAPMLDPKNPATSNAHPCVVEGMVRNFVEEFASKSYQAGRGGKSPDKRSRGESLNQLVDGEHEAGQIIEGDGYPTFLKFPRRMNTLTVQTPLQFECAHAKPRMVKLVQEKPKKEWNLATSNFKQRALDSDSHTFYDTKSVYDKAFAADWAHCKVKKFITNPVLLDSIRTALRTFYPDLTDVYKAYCCRSRDLDSDSCMSWRIFTEFVMETKIPEQGDDTCDLQSIDSIFIASTVQLKEMKALNVNPERALARFELLEAIVRIAKDKYMSDGRTESMHEAITMLCEVNILPNAERYNSDFFRKTKLYTKAIDETIGDKMDMLKSLYHKYGGQKGNMDWRSFTHLLHWKHIYDTEFTSREARLAFRLSSMAAVDEMGSDNCCHLKFIDFVEALCRIANMLVKLAQADAAQDQFTSTRTASLPRKKPPVLLSKDALAKEVESLATRFDALLWKLLKDESNGAAKKQFQRSARAAMIVKPGLNKAQSMNNLGSKKNPFASIATVVGAAGDSKQSLDSNAAPTSETNRPKTAMRNMAGEVQSALSSLKEHHNRQDNGNRPRNKTPEGKDELAPLRKLPKMMSEPNLNQMIDRDSKGRPMGRRGTKANKLAGRSLGMGGPDRSHGSFLQATNLKKGGSDKSAAKANLHMMSKGNDHSKQFAALMRARKAQKDF